MLRRGNRDTLHADQARYQEILRKYDHIGEEKLEGENLLIFLIFSVCTILTLGSLISIYLSLTGR